MFDVFGNEKLRMENDELLAKARSLQEQLDKRDEEKNTLKADIERLEISKRSLKGEISELGLKLKIETEDIQHMVKITSEKKEIELEKERIKITAEKNKEIARIGEDFRDKTEVQLKTYAEDLKNMYNEVLKRLPNYNVEVSKNG